MKGVDMIRHKKIVIPLTALVLAGGMAFTSSRALATGTSIPTQQDLIQRIAARFGLKESEVQSVVEQHRLERFAAKKAHYEAYLAQAVKNGEISEAQKAKILSKHAEILATREADRSAHQALSAEERRAAFDKKRADLEKWAKENGIDTKYLVGFGKGGMYMGNGWGKGR